ncbi:MAG: hypothetical protein RIB79_02615 [Allomuricauda sp.]
MKKTLFLILILLTSFSVFSQNYIFIGDNQFESTNTWKFEMNATYWTGNPELTVAKNDNGSGYLMISIDVPFKSTYIGGTIFLFLEDGSTIKCTDKGVRDHVDDQSIAVYNFTKDEINLLKSKKIGKIRFSILGGHQGKETFTANNKKPLFISFDKKEKEYYETDVEISNLFN